MILTLHTGLSSDFVFGRWKSTLKLSLKNALCDCENEPTQTLKDVEYLRAMCLGCCCCFKWLRPLWKNCCWVSVTQHSLVSGNILRLGCLSCYQKISDFTHSGCFFSSPSSFFLRLITRFISLLTTVEACGFKLADISFFPLQVWKSATSLLSWQTSRSPHPFGTSWKASRRLWWTTLTVSRLIAPKHSQFTHSDARTKGTCSVTEGLVKKSGVHIF